MARTCNFSFRARSGTAEWSFDGASLVLTPEAGGPIAVQVRETTGVSGDGYTVRVGLYAPGSSAEGEVLELSKLGHDGPTLLEAFRREWLPARAKALRLGGSGEGWRAAGWITGLDGATGASAPGGSGDGAEPFLALLFEDVLVIAREGRDLEPLFLSLFDAVKFDETTYTVRVREWPGRDIVFSKLARQTDEFVKRLRQNRTLLTEETAATLTAAVPTLPAGSRSVLAGTWMPGRLLDLTRMNAFCPGFEAALETEWRPGLVRSQEAAYLMAWATPESTWLGCTREAGTGGGVGAAGATEVAAVRPLWMLAGKNGVWFLEALSLEDRATYCFTGSEEVPALVSRLLCAPEFSKEALYSPLEQLTGESAGLAIPAQYLGFLVELRARFCGRVIHQTLEGWRKEVERLGRGE